MAVRLEKSIKLVHFTVLYSLQIVYMCFIWYPVAIGAIIKWSIPGLLKRSDSEGSSVKEFTLVRRSTLEMRKSSKIAKY